MSIQSMSPEGDRGTTPIDTSFFLPPALVGGQKIPPSELSELVNLWHKMKEVPRWQKGDPPIKRPDRPLFSESNAEHVEEGILFIRFCYRMFPALGAYIDFQQAGDMFWIHDLPESSPKSGGDLNRTNPLRKRETLADKREKPRRELRIFLEEFLHKFPSERQPHFKKIAERYYLREDRWVEVGVLDLTAAFAKLVDFFQGMSQAVFNFYANPHMLSPEIDHVNKDILEERIKENILELFKRIIEIDNGLFWQNNIKIDAQAYSEWKELVELLISPIRNNAYWEYALLILDEFPTIKTLLVQIPPIIELGPFEFDPNPNS